MAKLKAFKILVINSWKYAGACANPKGTLTYSYLLKGELNTVLGIEDLYRGIWWYPTYKSKVEKYFAPFNLEKKYLQLQTWAR